jgi:hypothetical protein
MSSSHVFLLLGLMLYRTWWLLRPSCLVPGSLSSAFLSRKKDLKSFDAAEKIIAAVSKLKGLFDTDLPGSYDEPGSYGLANL